MELVFVLALASTLHPGCNLGDDGTNGVGSACEVDEDCDAVQRCEWNICLGENGTGPAPVERSEGSILTAVGRACERLHGDCRDICDNVFVECYSSEAQCARQWTAQYLEDYAYPLVDDELATQCALQIDDQPCTDLEPDTLECEFAIVEGCRGDDDGNGMPYSPFRAAPVAASGPFEVMLCEGVAEYYRIMLEQGQRLVVSQGDDDQDVEEFELMRLVGTPDERAVLDSIGRLRFGDSSPPAPLAGEYLLRMEAWETKRLSFSVAVEG